MSTIELGLQELGLLDAALTRCAEEGKSLVQLITEAVSPGKVATVRSGEEYSSMVCTADDAECWHRMMSDPEYYSRVLARNREVFGEWDLTSEEVRELCQD